MRFAAIPADFAASTAEEEEFNKESWERFGAPVAAASGETQAAMTPEDARLARYRERNQAQALYGAGVAGGLSAGALLTVDQDNDSALYQDRLDALRAAGATDFDPALKRTYLNQGAYGLITDRSTERLKELVPSGVTSFEPSDLSQAGRIPDLLQAPGSGGDGAVQRQVTVSPGSSPRRLSYEGLSADDLVPGEGQKGYIWANPGEPQYGYAHGNLMRGRVQARNPAINLLAVEMDPGAETLFRTTGEIVEDPAFASERRWGQRQYGDTKGDVMFPKESIRARAEVTAADLYTRLKEQGALPAGFEERNLSPRGFDAGKALKELTETYAERAGKPPVEALLEVATPVSPLGVSGRKAGQLPVFQRFAIQQAAPESLRQSGIGPVFETEWNDGRGTAGKRDLLVTTPRPWPLNGDEHFRVNPDLVEPRKSRAGNFLRRQSGLGAALAGAVVSPDVIEAYEQGRPAEAVARAGTAVLAGAAGESVSKQVLSALAQRGVVAPLRAVSAVAPPVAAVQLATMAQRTTRATPAQVIADKQAAARQINLATAARARGSRMSIGPVKIPELGLSESGGLFFGGQAQRPLGSRSVLNGRSVVWTGDSYGWQSPMSAQKLGVGLGPSGGLLFR